MLLTVLLHPTIYFDRALLWVKGVTDLAGATQAVRTLGGMNGSKPLRKNSDIGLP